MASNFTRSISSGPACVPGQRYEIDRQRYNNLVQLAKLYYNPPPKNLPDWELALKVLFYIPPFIIDVIGNIMVILIVILNKRMRTTTNVLILNLSVADISVALFCMWIHLGVEFTRDWHFGPFFCRFHLFIKVVAVTSSVLTMTIISVERFVAIVFPLRSKIKVKVALFAILVSWILSVGTASPYLFIMKEESLQFKNRRKIECVEKWPEYYNSSCGKVMPHRKLYYTLAVIVMYVVPVIIMAVTYTIIVIKLIFKKAPGGGRTSEAQEKRKRKVITMLIAILVSFVICWTPQQYLLLWDAYRSATFDKNIRVIKYVALYLAYSNSAINPIMYAGFNENFRRGFVDVFRCALWKERNRVHSDMISTAQPNGNGLPTLTTVTGNLNTGRSSSRRHLVTENQNVNATATSSTKDM